MPWDDAQLHDGVCIESDIAHGSVEELQDVDSRESVVQQPPPALRDGGCGERELSRRKYVCQRSLAGRTFHPGEQSRLVGPGAPDSQAGLIIGDRRIVLLEDVDQSG